MRLKYAVTVCFALSAVIVTCVVFGLHSPVSTTLPPCDPARPQPAFISPELKPSESVSSEDALVSSSPSTSSWQVRFCDIANQSGPMQEEMLSDLAAAIPDDQIEGALDKLEKEQSDPSMTLIVFLGERWAERSPADAAQWAERHMSDDPYGHNLFSNIMTPWSQRDLEGATAFVRHLPDNGNKAAAAFSLATEAAKQKKGILAIQLAAFIPASQERDALLSFSAQQWATTDVTSAISWVDQLNDPTMRENILGKIATNLGAQDPAAGAKLIGTAMSDGPDRDNATATVVRFWASATPADAADWVTHFPEGELRDVATANLVDTWGKNSLSDAIQWVNRLPAGHSHEVAEETLENLEK